MGASINSQGRFVDAEAVLRRSVLIRERTFGRDSPAVAESLMYVGAAVNGQGRFADAEALFRRSVAIREKTLGLDNPSVAESLAGLGIAKRIAPTPADRGNLPTTIGRSLTRECNSSHTRTRFGPEVAEPTLAHPRGKKSITTARAVELSDRCRNFRRAHDAAESDMQHPALSDMQLCNRSECGCASHNSAHVYAITSRCTKPFSQPTKPSRNKALP